MRGDPWEGVWAAHRGAEGPRPGWCFCVCLVYLEVPTLLCLQIHISQEKCQFRGDVRSFGGKQHTRLSATRCLCIFVSSPFLILTGGCLFYHCFVWILFIFTRELTLHFTNETKKCLFCRRREGVGRSEARGVGRRGRLSSAKCPA